MTRKDPRMRACRVCRLVLFDVLSRGVHPLCAPGQDWWTDPELEKWSGKAAARRAEQEALVAAHGSPRAAAVAAARPVKAPHPGAHARAAAEWFRKQDTHPLADRRTA